MREAVKVRFARLREGAVIPSKRKGDIGYDLYCCNGKDQIVIMPHKTEIIPLGIASIIPEGFYMQLCERSLTGANGIKLSAGLMDTTFRGEWHVQLYNSNDVKVIIDKGVTQITVEEYDGTIHYPYSKAVAQAILREEVPGEIIEVTPEEIAADKTERGAGERGSSGK